jgi:hypothetical protein
MSVINQTDGVGWNLGDPVGPVPSLMQVESDLEVVDPHR